ENAGIVAPVLDSMGAAMKRTSTGGIDTGPGSPNTPPDSSECSTGRKTIGTACGRGRFDRPVLAVPSSTAAPSATWTVMEATELNALIVSLLRGFEIDGDRNPGIDSCPSEPSGSESSGTQCQDRRRREFHGCRTQHQD